MVNVPWAMTTRGATALGPGKPWWASTAVYWPTSCVLTMHAELSHVSFSFTTLFIFVLRVPKALPTFKLTSQYTVAPNRSSEKTTAM